MWRKVSLYLLVWTLVGTGSAWAVQYLIDPGPGDNRVVLNSGEFHEEEILGCGAPEACGVWGELGDIQSAHRWHISIAGSALVWSQPDSTKPPVLKTVPARFPVGSESWNESNCLGDCQDGKWRAGVTNGGFVQYEYLAPLSTNLLTFAIDTTQGVEENPFWSHMFGCENSYGAFIEANHTENILSIRWSFPPSQGMIPIEQRPTLDQIGSLTVSFFHRVDSVEEPNPCPPPLNVANTLIGVEFVDTATGQRVWYHLVSYDSRGLTFRGAWFLNGPQEFLVADDVAVYGWLPLTPGEGGHLYAVDIASRVKALLQAGGPDTDLSHWKVAGFYSGTMTNGHARIQSAHGLLGLSDDTPGQ